MKNKHYSFRPGIVLIIIALLFVALFGSNNLISATASASDNEEPVKLEYYTSGAENSVQFQKTQWQAQTFTPSVTQIITSVKVRLHRQGNPGVITAAIKATDIDGHPVGVDLCFGTVDENNLTTAGAGEFKEITLGTGAILKASTKYALVLKALNGNSLNKGFWTRDASSPTYTGGNMETTTDGGLTWKTTTTSDYMFQEWGTVFVVNQVTDYIDWGANLCGLDFGQTELVPGGVGHGTINRQYVSPTLQELDYLKAAGMTVLRLPFRWERVQHSLYGELDPFDIGLIDKLVQAASARGMKLILDPHNYGRYYDASTNKVYVLGSPELPNRALADLWSRLAQRYTGNPGIYGYDLMNEPHDMPTGKDGWKQACQDTIDAIRKVDMRTRIIVPGYHWSNVYTWKTESNTLLYLVDPGDNLIYEAHEYFDDARTGNYSKMNVASVPLTRGTDWFSPYINWLRDNHKQGIIGENGVPGTDAWLNILDSLLSYVKANDDVLIAYQAWFIAPWNRTSVLSLEPTTDNNGKYIDKPQMTIIKKYSASNTDQDSVR